MRARIAWIPFVIFASLALIALLIAALQPRRLRVFTLHAPNAAQVALLLPGHGACEGPIVSPEPVGAVRIWGTAVVGVAQLAAQVHDTSSRATLAHGNVIAGTTPSELTATLDRPVPRRQSLRVCLTNRGPGSFSLAGSAPVTPGVLITEHGKTQRAEFSLVLLSAGSPSLLASLGTAFSRAALFRPSWVGPWTFWVLAVALVGTIALGAAAIRAAAIADEKRHSVAPDNRNSGTDREPAAQEPA
jgi:hypothetical protein